MVGEGVGKTRIENWESTRGRFQFDVQMFLASDHQVTRVIPKVGTSPPPEVFKLGYWSSVDWAP